MSSYSLKQWYNLKLKVDVNNDKVDVYIDDQPAGSFPFTTTNFASYGIGRILSKTPGGGSGNYYLDNLKIYVEPIETPLGLTGLPGNQAAQLSWPALEGATSYNVKRSLKSGGLMRLLPMLLQRHHILIMKLPTKLPIIMLSRRRRPLVNREIPMKLVLPHPLWR